jgi:hypothetical protein
MLLAGSLCLPVASAHTYVYSGQPFGVNGENTLLGATNISVEFEYSTYLEPSTEYRVSSPMFSTMTISDGINTISPGTGQFLGSSFIRTDAAGGIRNWFIVELIGFPRSFVLDDRCCTIDDPPFLYTIHSNGSTDASVQNNGAFGIGPREGFAYNNQAPGCWSVDGLPLHCPSRPSASIPEPTAWMMMILGFFALGVVLRGRRCVVVR